MDSERKDGGADPQTGIAVDPSKAVARKNDGRTFWRVVRFVAAVYVIVTGWLIWNLEDRQQPARSPLAADSAVSSAAASGRPSVSSEPSPVSRYRLDAPTAAEAQEGAAWMMARAEGLAEAYAEGAPEPNIVLVMSYLDSAESSIEGVMAALEVSAGRGPASVLETVEDSVDYDIERWPRLPPPSRREAVASMAVVVGCGRWISFMGLVPVLDAMMVDVAAVGPQNEWEVDWFRETIARAGPVFDEARRWPAAALRCAEARATGNSDYDGDGPPWARFRER